MHYGYAHRRYQRIQLRRLSAELHKPPWLLQGPHDLSDRLWWWFTQSWRDNQPREDTDG